MKATRSTNSDKGKCIAYIDARGYIYFTDSDETFCLFNDGGVTSAEFNEQNAVHKFYKGDSVTITF